MDILILYETYSGGTLSASEYISSYLKTKKYNTTLLETHKSDPSTYTQYDFIIMGTPSWLEREKEGQPHIYFLEFMDRAKDISFQNIQFALFGLGDSTYAHFCKAVDTLEAFIKEKGGTIIGQPLKIDGYFFEQEKGKKLLSDWLQLLPFK